MKNEKIMETIETETDTVGDISGGGEEKMKNKEDIQTSGEDDVKMTKEMLTDGEILTERAADAATSGETDTGCITETTSGGAADAESIAETTASGEENAESIAETTASGEGETAFTTEISTSGEMHVKNGKKVIESGEVGLEMTDETAPGGESETGSNPPVRFADSPLYTREPCGEGEEETTFTTETTAGGEADTENGENAADSGDYEVEITIEAPPGGEKAPLAVVREGVERLAAAARDKIGTAKSAGDLRSLASVLRYVNEMLRDFYNDPTPGDAQARRIAAERMEIDREKAALAAASDAADGIEVVIPDEAEEWAE